MPDESTLTFALRVDGDWPPVAAEVVPCRVGAHGVRVLAAPFFVSGLSAGDVIDAHRGAGGEVVSWEHLFKSARSTVWLLGPNSAALKNELEVLRNAGCSVRDYPGEPLTLLDLPPSVSADLFDECIGPFIRTEVAVAYPSWRHGRPR